MSNYDNYYVDLSGMLEARKINKTVFDNVQNSMLTYVHASAYEVSEEYDVSNIADSKRKNIVSLVSGYNSCLDELIRALIMADMKAGRLLLKYQRMGYLGIPSEGDPNNPTIGVIGNSYYYYEGYPAMLKGFLNNDVNIDIAISSRIGLETQQKLLEAAAKNDKEEFNRIFREYLSKELDNDKRYDDLTKEQKKYQSMYMTEHNLQDGQPTSIVWEGYRRMADPNRKQDAVVIEGMSLDEKGKREALKKITNMMLDKNEKMVIIIDDYDGHTEDEQRKLINDLKKEHPNANIQINSAKTANHEVANALGKKWTNEAERDGIPHPNKVSTYTNARQTANALSDPLGISTNSDYDGSTTGAYYCDSTYGVVQLPRNNFDDDRPRKGSTDSGTDDKTDNYMQLTPEEKAIVDPIVDKYKPFK